jgi:hypothetical protein
MREDAHRAHDAIDDIIRKANEAAIGSSNVVLKAMLLINGGAVISLLALMGPLAAAQKVAVANSLLSFVWGIVFTVIGMAFAYFTNYLTAVQLHSWTRKWEHPYLETGPTTKRISAWMIACHILAVLSLAISLAWFVVGVSAVRDAITNLA